MTVKVVASEEEFQTEVLESDVPVFVDFYADWCGPCKVMLPIFTEVADMIDEAEAKFVKVNVDSAGNLPATYNIRSIPTVIKFNNGEVEATNVGPMNKIKMIKFTQDAE